MPFLSLYCCWSSTISGTGWNGKSCGLLEPSELAKAERNYSTIERKALAAVAAIKEFYTYLYGFHFDLITDHNPLTSLKGMKDVGGRLTRWTVFLQQFNFTIKYKPGKQHGNADGLSRTPVSDDTLVASITCLGNLMRGFKKSL